VIEALVTPLLGGKKVIFPIPKNLMASLVSIRALVESGSFKPVIDREYPLDKIADAYRYVATGQKIGNVIINMDA
jgi:NADPH:quinone reductase-like Zn-dependent oxidoreductase